MQPLGARSYADGEWGLFTGKNGATRVVPNATNPGVNTVAIQLEDKKAIVAEVNETAAQALSLVVADARGVKVSAMTALRKSAREQAIEIRVVRNTLAKRALQGTDYECINGALTGPSLFGFSMEDPGAAARLFKDFAKTNDKFEVKALAVSGQMLGPEQLDVLAKLPTREQALSMLMGVMKAPIGKLARTLNEVPGKLVRTLAAVREQKEQAA